MPHHEPSPSATSERGASIALIFALLAERLRTYYELATEFDELCG